MYEISKHFSGKNPRRFDLTSVTDCCLIDLPRITSHQGSLTAVESKTTIPFGIARVYYLYDIPGGATRGGHAHVELEQVLVSVLGACEVILDDGSKSKSVRLDRASCGLYIPQGIWREMKKFTSGAVCVVLASTPYRSTDYIRNYASFVEQKQQAT